MMNKFKSYSILASPCDFNSKKLHLLCNESCYDKIIIFYLLKVYFDPNRVTINSFLRSFQDDDCVIFNIDYDVDNGKWLGYGGEIILNLSFEEYNFPDSVIIISREEINSYLSKYLTHSNKQLRNFIKSYLES